MPLSRAPRRVREATVDVALAQPGVERAGRGNGRDRFGDRELAFAVTQLGQMREEVNRGQIRLVGNPLPPASGSPPSRSDRFGKSNREHEPAALCWWLVRGEARGPSPGQAVEVEPGTRARPASSSSRRPSWATPIAAVTSDIR